MWFIERVFVPIEDQYKYISDEDEDTNDEEWTLEPKKKKPRNDTIAVSTGEFLLLDEFFSLQCDCNVSIFC